MYSSLSPVDVALAGVLGERALLREGRITAMELLGLTLVRIDALDGRLNAFRTLARERGQAEAEAADAAPAAGDEWPLLGVPVAAKNNLHARRFLGRVGSGRRRGPGGPGHRRRRRRLGPGARRELRTDWTAPPAAGLAGPLPVGNLGS